MLLSDRIKETFTNRPEARAIEFDGHWYCWCKIRAIAEAVLGGLAEAGSTPDMPVGVVVRNRVPHAAALLGLIAAQHRICLIYAFQSPEAVAREITTLKLGAVIADAQDWTPPVRDAAQKGLGIVLNGTGPGAVSVIGSRQGNDVWRDGTEEPWIALLTSGTTGAPKRVHLPFRVLERAISSVLFAPADREPDVQINIWPLGGVGGICMLSTNGVAGAPLVLMEKFSVDAFMGAVKRNKPPMLGLSPTALRMILDAGVPRADMAGVRMVSGGSAPLDPDLQERFEEVYGLPVLWGYGATEFCGTVIRWTMELREAFGMAKRGSIGRAMPGVSIKAVSPETGEPVPPETEGLLHVRVAEIDADWLKTTDLVVIDEDGFVFHRGRYDGAILRGGFKILPERVADVLRQHPDVGDAVVVGLADDRLGQVPVAAIELRLKRVRPEIAALEDLVRRHLPATHAPVHYLIADALPRTPSLKPDLRAVRALFGA